MNVILWRGLLACGPGPVDGVVWGPACDTKVELSEDAIVWTSFGDSYFPEAEGVAWITSEEDYATLWTKEHGSRPLAPDFATEKLLYAMVHDSQSCFEPVLQTAAGTTSDGSQAYLMVYDDDQDCDSIRDFAVLFLFDAAAEVTPCLAMVGP